MSHICKRNFSLYVNYRLENNICIFNLSLSKQKYNKTQVHTGIVDLLEEYWDIRNIAYINCKNEQLSDREEYLVRILEIFFIFLYHRKFQTNLLKDSLFRLCQSSSKSEVTEYSKVNQ